jgi:superfamily I DNA/RNA helicase
MALKPGQLKCINTLDKPIVVAAGAGSGKTFTLTKRIVGALKSGYVQDIGQV